jgi:hypothetical protein
MKSSIVNCFTIFEELHNTENSFFFSLSRVLFLNIIVTIIIIITISSNGNQARRHDDARRSTHIFNLPFDFFLLLSSTEKKTRRVRVREAHIFNERNTVRNVNYAACRTEGE